MFNLCLIIADFNIYTEAKESELYSFLVFKAFFEIQVISLWSLKAFENP